MKKIICLISLIVTEYLFADVLSNRYDDGNVHYGLPSWISLADHEQELNPGQELPDNYTLVRNNDYFDYAADKKVIDLPESFSIEFLGKEYSSIVIHKSGKIEFGNGVFDYVDHPYVSLLDASFSLGMTFEWGVFSQKIDDKRENILVITFGPASYYLKTLKATRVFSMQVLIYPNGECQVQYWNYGNLEDSIEPWAKPVFFDGYTMQSASVTKGGSSEYIDIYGSDGLRSGWIAKAMRSEYSVDITEPQKGAGLHVQMKSAGTDLGGIIAYDYSREHPVVGGISSVEVSASNLPVEKIHPLYCWYFDEYYTTSFAHYEKWLSNDVTELSLTKADYEYTWNAYKTNPNRKSNFILRTDESMNFIGAPAFKFQRVSYSSSENAVVYDFNINRIRYFLAQPKSIQFLPNKNMNHLIVENSTGGIVEFTGLKGLTDASNSYRKTYDVRSGQNINGSILASPGYFIDQIMLSYDGAENNISVVYNNDNLLLKNVSDVNFSVTQEKREIRITGNMINASNVVLKIIYKKCETRELAPIIPAMEKTVVYSGPQSFSENRSISSVKIMNAFGGVAQKQKKIAEGEYAVSSEYTNGMDQKTRVPMDFVHKSKSGDFEYVDMACEGCITEANAYYYKRSGVNSSSNQGLSDDDIDRPDAENNAFTETKYFNGNSKNNGAISASAGIAKRSFAFNDDSYAQVWEMPAISENDFIPHDKLDESFLVNAYKQRNDFNINKELKYNFLLKIHRDSEGKYTQEIFNTRGLVESSWFYDGNKEQIIVYEYDEFGNLEKSYNKDYRFTGAKTTYDAQGRVKSVESYDGGITQNRYDSKGRLRFVKTSLHDDGSFLSYFFDGLGRTVAVGEVFGMSSSDFENPDMDIPEANIKYVSKSIYGKPSLKALENLGVNRSLAQSILSMMAYIRPNNLGAVIAYDADGNMVSIKISEYDRIGQKKYQWVILGLNGVPPIQLSYDYNLSGDMIRSVFSQWNGSDWDSISTRTRDYDEQGRLVSTKENGHLLSSYRYTKNGNVREKLYYDNDKLVFRKKISRDVYDRPIKITYFDKENGGKEFYSTVLDFKSPEVNQVDNVSHEWKSVKGNADFSRNSSYEYDYSGRLTSVVGALPGSYGYDALGRITKKIEGDTTIGYAYTQPSYRPTGVNVNGGSPAASAVYLKYDAVGNVWYDKHNLTVYKNGKNNMPLKVFKFTSMPEDITLDDVNKESNVLNGAVEKISIAYDEHSDRIWYSYDNMVGGNSFTRVTLPGVGVFEAQKTNGVNGSFSLVRQDLVAGGYRDAGGNAHFPVMDAQGNVRGYATTRGLESAYDYYAYGTIDDLAPNAGDDNKRWQDKEYDGEHGKYYFGSRYFDPFFGLWMSPDPAGQFANPYTYGGDPLNYVDPNGESIIAVATVAIVGAIISGGSEWIDCDKGTGFTAGCWSKVGKSALIGAVAGAAGSISGGALSGAGTIASGAVGGFVSNSAGAVTDALVNDHKLTSTQLGIQVGMGALNGGLNGLFNAGFSKIKAFNYATILRDGLSSSATEMVIAGFSRDKSTSKVGLRALGRSMLSSLFNSLVDRGLTQLVFEFGGVDALNKWHDLGNGKWMLEQDAVQMENSETHTKDGYMNTHKGAVSASVAGLDVGFLIMVISGAGPFSHVRASDMNGDVIEMNSAGVMEYGDPEYAEGRNGKRLTYVTDRYAGGELNGQTVKQLKGKMDYWPKMCTGASQLVNPLYGGGAPNNFVPYAYRNLWRYTSLFY